jgi:hypothetical protein
MSGAINATKPLVQSSIKAFMQPIPVAAPEPAADSEHDEVVQDWGLWGSFHCFGFNPIPNLSTLRCKSP